MFTPKVPTKSRHRSTLEKGFYDHLLLLFWDADGHHVLGQLYRNGIAHKERERVEDKSWAYYIESEPQIVCHMRNILASICSFMAM